jgi:hypothetical protein
MIRFGEGDRLSGFANQLRIAQAAEMPLSVLRDMPTA